MIVNNWLIINELYIEIKIFFNCYDYSLVANRRGEGVGIVGGWKIFQILIGGRGWNNRGSEQFSDLRAIYFWWITFYLFIFSRHRNRILLSFAFLGQKVQHWDRQYNTGNTVLFSTNQIADILYINDNYHSDAESYIPELLIKFLVFLFLRLFHMRFDLVEVRLWSYWDVGTNIDVNIYESVSKCILSGLDFQVLFIKEF